MALKFFHFRIEKILKKHGIGKCFLMQWFLTWVPSNPQGWMEPYQGFDKVI